MARRSPVKNPQIGRNVRRLRKEMKISIRKFCERMEPPIAPVQLIATEKLRREPTLDMVKRYAKVLDCTIEDLLKDAPPTDAEESPPKQRKKTAGVRR